jgi:2-hydroxycyclohexanecarboxyl-CoA dehydrogenase
MGRLNRRGEQQRKEDLMTNSGLAGRVAVVTGAAGGIGRAIAAALYAEGASVAVADLNGDAADAHAAELAAAGWPGRALGVRVDISSSADVSAAVGLVERELGPVDVLVNNAGIDVIEPFVESKEETWRRIVEVNYLGPVVCTRAVLDGMIERGYGRIISVSSDAGKVGSSGEVVYSGTKGGIIAFSKALAREMAVKGITVNCVCPGPTETPLLGQIAERSQKMYDSLARAVPMRRLGQPADIAPAVVFLASDCAAFITGQALSVSGGLTMS